MDEYISREEAIDKIKSLKGTLEAVYDWDIGYDTAIARIVKHIKRMSAADVQSVKHGRWECEFYNDIFDVYQADCSVCKRETTNTYDKVSEVYEYCPHCGARMDLEED